MAASTIKLRGVSRTPVISVSPDKMEQNPIGFNVWQARAAEALKIGDVVYLNSDGEVAKSATAATVGATFAGVVVGGSKTKYEVVVDSGLVGTVVCAADEMVLVAEGPGIVWVNATAATITVGNKISGSATAGLVLSSGSDAQFGIALSIPAGGAAAGGAIKMKFLPSTTIKA